MIERSWYDMSMEEQGAYVEQEAMRIAVRIVRRLVAAGKRSAKKVDGVETGVAGRIVRSVAEKISRVV